MSVRLACKINRMGRGVNDAITMGLLDSFKFHAWKMRLQLFNARVSISQKAVKRVGLEIGATLMGLKNHK